MRNTAGIVQEFENERPCGMTFLNLWLVLSVIWKLCGWRLRTHAHGSQVVLMGICLFARTPGGVSLIWTSGFLAVYFLIMKYQRKIHMLLIFNHPPAVAVRPWDKVLASGIGNFQIWPLKSALRLLSLFSSILQSKNWRKYRSLNHLLEKTQMWKLLNPPKTVLGWQLWVVLRHWNLFCFCTDHSSTEETKERTAFYKDELRYFTQSTGTSQGTQW